MDREIIYQNTHTSKLLLLQLHSAKRYTFKSNLESTNSIISVKISVIGSIYHYVPQIGYLEIYIIKVFYYFSMFSQMGFELLFIDQKKSIHLFAVLMLIIILQG